MPTRSSPRRATVLAAASLAALASAASAETINPNPAPPGNRSGATVTGVNKTPAHLCQAGTMRFVAATRQLTLPSERYCTDKDWNVRDVRVEGANLLWRVPFTNGHVDCSCTHAAGTATPPSPATADRPATPPGGADRITAGIAMRELRALGFQPELSADDRGLPRISVAVDGYRWAILFYTCDAGGALEERRCSSLQFFSGYTMQAPVSAVTMNKWNTDKRFARGYSFTSGDGKSGARVEVDVFFANTGGDPARTFRAYYNIMKIQAADFRKLINFE